MEQLTDSEGKDDLRYDVLWRLTGGIPQHELKTIISEASECEAALEREIAMLEVAAKGEGEIPANDNNETPVAALPKEYDATSTGKNFLSSARDILNTELTPLDRYFTVSSILGRLREPLETPLIPHMNGNTAGENPKKKNKTSNAAQQTKQKALVDKYRKVVMLKEHNEIYTKVQTDNTSLLALVKRISNHRTAAVFRRAVNPKEAPSYEERILFPVDLALIKKFVLCGHINTFERLHQYIGMICHNCVKFNGRYSDYALLTRDFEAYVDDSFLDFMQKQKDKAAAQLNK